MKRFLTLAITTLFIITAPTISALAVETTAYDTTTVGEYKNNVVDYSNYNFPNDAVILYQSEDGVIYQSNEKTSEENVELQSARSMTYNGVWINAGHAATGSFTIQNPHTIINKTNGTFKVESEYSNATAQFILHDGIKELANETVKASDGDVHFEFKSNIQNLSVTYFVTRTSPSKGMRLNCWLW